MRMTLALFSGLTLLTAALLGCSSQASGPDPSLSDKLCVVEEYEPDAVAKTCTTGQKVAFMPRQFGNEQLPVMFAALNCDMRYGVALTKGAVTCIYQRAESSDQG